MEYQIFHRRCFISALFPFPCLEANCQFQGVVVNVKKSMYIRLQKERTCCSKTKHYAYIYKSDSYCLKMRKYFKICIAVFAFMSSGHFPMFTQFWIDFRISGIPLLPWTLNQSRLTTETQRTVTVHWMRKVAFVSGLVNILCESIATTCIYVILTIGVFQREFDYTNLSYHCLTNVAGWSGGMKASRDFPIDLKLGPKAIWIWEK